jgi:hypothetical protein
LAEGKKTEGMTGDTALDFEVYWHNEIEYLMVAYKNVMTCHS